VKCLFRRFKMARPIAPTPVIKGKDAVEFRDRMEKAVMTPERLQWLKTVAEESKRAENGKK
jgi:hypothetical protein